MNHSVSVSSLSHLSSTRPGRDSRLTGLMDEADGWWSICETFFSSCFISSSPPLLLPARPLDPPPCRQRNLAKVPFKRFIGLLLLNTENVFLQKHTHTHTHADETHNDRSTLEFQVQWCGGRLCRCLSARMLSHLLSSVRPGQFHSRRRCQQCNRTQLLSKWVPRKSHRVPILHSVPFFSCRWDMRTFSWLLFEPLTACRDEKSFWFIKGGHAKALHSGVLPAGAAKNGQ